MNEEVKNELVEREESSALAIGNIDELGGNNSHAKLYTNIEDGKKLFNLDSNVETKLNDCVGETIRVKEYLFKIFEKEEEPTGEEEATKKVTRITILVDKDGKSYVTKSNMFAFKFIKLVQMGAFRNGECVDIKITKVSVKDSSNQALSFELV